MSGLESNQTLQFPMVKEKIHKVIIFPNLQMVFFAHEDEITASG